MPKTVWILTDRRYLGQRMPATLIDWLTGEGCPTRIIVVDDGARLCSVAPLAESLVPSAWERLEPGDLVVTRSRDAFALALLEEAEAREARVLDGAHAVQRVRHKATCALGLARRGLPIPPTLLASGPDDLGGLPASAYPLVVKPVLGDNAQGVHILASPDELGALHWDGQPLIAQAYVEAGGFDIKLYVAGDEVWATRRPGPLSELDDPVRRVDVTPELRSIADGCREEFGLTLFGVDVLEADGRLAIVDVNEFPNYTGVEEAPAAIGALVLAAADRSEVTTPERMSL